MAGKPTPDSDPGIPDLFEKRFAQNMNEDFASETDFRAWADAGTAPDEILIPENRKGYEAYLAKHGIKV